MGLHCVEKAKKGLGIYGSNQRLTSLCIYNHIIIYLNKYFFIFVYTYVHVCVCVCVASLLSKYLH